MDIFTKTNITILVLVILGVLAAAFISAKFGLVNKYEEYYEENFDESEYQDQPVMKRAA